MYTLEQLLHDEVALPEPRPKVIKVPKESHEALRKKSTAALGLLGFAVCSFNRNKVCCICHLRPIKCGHACDEQVRKTASCWQTELWKHLEHDFHSDCWQQKSTCLFRKPIGDLDLAISSPACHSCSLHQHQDRTAGVLPACRNLEVYASSGNQHEPPARSHYYNSLAHQSRVKTLP